jgi:hypothetical protein
VDVSTNFAVLKPGQIHRDHDSSPKLMPLAIVRQLDVFLSSDQLLRRFNSGRHRRSSC